MKTLQPEPSTLAEHLHAPTLTLVEVMGHTGKVLASRCNRKAEGDPAHPSYVGKRRPILFVADPEATPVEARKVCHAAYAAYCQPRRVAEFEAPARPLKIGARVQVVGVGSGHLEEQEPRPNGQAWYRVRLPVRLGHS